MPGGVSTVTAFEIASNPKDIVITYGGPDKVTGKFIGLITRGKGRNFKFLLSTESVYDTPQQAKNAMEEVVKQIKEAVAKKLKSPKTHSPHSEPHFGNAPLPDDDW